MLRANSLQGEGEDAARGGWRCCLGLGELLPSEAHRRSSPEVFAEAAAAFFLQRRCGGEAARRAPVAADRERTWEVGTGSLRVVLIDDRVSERLFTLTGHVAPSPPGGSNVLIPRGTLSAPLAQIQNSTMNSVK